MTLIIILFLLFLLNFLLFAGLNSLFRQRSKISGSYSEFSVIISARNEEKSLPDTINKLLLQTVPAPEIIIIDDFSTDGTYEKAVLFSDLNDNIYVLKNRGSQGKKQALTEAIMNSGKENILLTDADCLPESSWTKSFMERFGQGYEIVLGIAPIRIKKSLVSRVSAFENLRSSVLTFGGMSFGMPYSAAARSMGFRKTSFESISGYNKTMEVPYGDDDLLIREAVKNKLKIGAVTERDSFVYTDSEINFSGYFRQRKRHTRASFYYSFKIKFILAVWHIINLLPFSLAFLAPLNAVYAVPLLFKLLFDLTLLNYFQQKFGYKFSFFQLIYLQLLYEIFIVLHFINAQIGTIKWKV